MSLILSVLGAESTGKSTLAPALALALAQRTGQAWVCVDEYLREWVDAHGRTPRLCEQRGIAVEQHRRIAHAALGANVVADTSALMTAVYSAVIFGDESLVDFAMGAECVYHQTLLTSLDVPWQSDGLQRDGAHVRAGVDACLVRILTAGSRHFTRLSGLAAQQLSQAQALFDGPGEQREMV